MVEKKRLHIGCFDTVIDGWINTDITPHIWISRIPLLPKLLWRTGHISESTYQQHKAGIFRKVTRLDVTKRFPYGDNQFEAAFCSHLLEHLYPEDAYNCTVEVYRALKPGGIFRIVVPDLDRMIEDYNALAANRWMETFLEVKQSRIKNRHQWMYNEHSLSELLLRAGFQTVKRCAFQQGNCPDIELLDNRPSSLFMEGYKSPLH